MEEIVINFEDPAELLEAISSHRMAHVYLNQISGFKRQLSAKQVALSRLVEDIQPIQKILHKNREYFERGLYDRVGYEQAQEDPLIQQKSMYSQIKDLEREVSSLEEKISKFSMSVDPSMKFLEELQEKVVTYSIVQIRNRVNIETYLMVPNGLRNFVFLPELELLSTASDLGSTLMFQGIGKVSSSDPRFQDLEIQSVKIADDELLKDIHNLYLRFKYKTSQIIFQGVVSEDQRWRDGARHELYTRCLKCHRYIPVGSNCRC